MANITKTAAPVAPAQQPVYMDVFASGWNNEKNGKQFMTIRLRKGMQVSLGENDVIIARPNQKRPGKQDPDWQIGVMPALQQA